MNFINTLSKQPSVPPRTHQVGHIFYRLESLGVGKMNVCLCLRVILFRLAIRSLANRLKPKKLRVLYECTAERRAAQSSFAKFAFWFALDNSASSMRYGILHFLIHTCLEPARRTCPLPANRRSETKDQQERNEKCCRGFETCRTCQCSIGTFDYEPARNVRPSYQGLSH